MDEKPHVSVIMIVRDGEAFLGEAIESVLAQEYRSWELLVVDDGSSDGTPSIARALARDHPGRIIPLTHPGSAGLGMSASRNLGVRRARGRYVAFLDADDVWLPQYLGRRVDALSGRPRAGMVCGPTQWWYGWTGRSEDRDRDRTGDLGVGWDTLVEPPGLVPLLLQDPDRAPCTCSLVVRREVFDRVGAFEDGFTDLYEDQVFLVKACLAVPVFVARGCLARYRQHPGSACARAAARGTGSAARGRFLAWVREHVEESGITDPAVRRALGRETLKVRHPLVAPLAARARRALAGGLERARSVGAWRLSRLPVARRLRCLGLRRLRPLGDGRLRGTPIVRYYWDRFLQRHRADIQGEGLEVGTTATLRRLGADRIRRADAIDVEAHHPEVTVVADLTRADPVPADRYDCFINQFTMHVLHDVESALHHSLRVLKPGGVLLVNFPCVEVGFPSGLDMGTGIPLYLYGTFTEIQVETLLRRAGLGPGDFEVEVSGNLFARIAYEMNLCAEELTEEERVAVDRAHPLLISVRAVKPPGWEGRRPEPRPAWRPAGTPERWDPVYGHHGAPSRARGGARRLQAAHASGR